MSNKVNSNNYKQAVKEITALDADQVNKIPETINQSDKRYFHVALVRITDRPGQPKNDVNVNVQQFWPNGFEKLKKSFPFQGFAKLVIIHDPTKPAEKTTQAVTKPKTQKSTNDTGDQKEADTTSEKEELEKEFQFAIGGNKPELIDFAKTNNIDLSEASNNDQRVKAITEWFNQKMDELSNQ